MTKRHNHCVTLMFLVQFCGSGERKEVGRIAEKPSSQLVMALISILLRPLRRSVKLLTNILSATG